MIEVISLGKRINAELSESFNKPIDLIWRCFTEPKDIVKWFSISENYYCSFAFNSLKVGETFMYRMSPKDQGISFDIEGRFKEIILNNLIVCTQGNTILTIYFNQRDDSTDMRIHIDYDPEDEYGDMSFIWKSLLSNFKLYINNM